MLACELVHGDAALLDLIEARAPARGAALIAIDAPIVCHNPTGARPVDRLTHRLFHREHAGCHPANRARCARPVRLLEELEARGWRAGWQLTRGARLVAEVYPHPAMVRLFGLARILKYKRGPVDARRLEFRRLQRLLEHCRRAHFAGLVLARATRSLLCSPWSKASEDRTDALFCALIGLWHWRHRGQQSEVLGDLARAVPRKTLPSLAGRS